MGKHILNSFVDPDSTFVSCLRVLELACVESCLHQTYFSGKSRDRWSLINVNVFYFVRVNYVVKANEEAKESKVFPHEKPFHFLTFVDLLHALRCCFEAVSAADEQPPLCDRSPVSVVSSTSVPLASEARLR